MIASKATGQARLGRHTWRTALLGVWAVLLIGGVLLLALVNLPYAPRTWFDEGSHLHVPKTLVQHGVYADISSEGYRYYGPTVGVGPTVMLPVALAFKLFGIGLLQARLVIALYLFAGLAAFFALSRRLYGTTVALLAATLLLASRTLAREGYIEYGRQVLGEVPGLAFLFLGALAWVLALRTSDGARRAEDGGWFWPAAAGLGFGLALVTKNQFVLIVPPALALVALLDGAYYHAASWRLRLVPLIVACACFGAWTLAQFQFLGPGGFAENMRQMQQAAGGAIFVFDLRATLRAGAYLLRPDLYGGLLIPALGYGLWQARRRDARGLAEALVALLVALWLLWFVGASLGWPRYAFPAVGFGALLVARLLADTITWLRRGAGRRRTLAWAAAAYTAVIVAVPLALSARAALSADDSAQRFAAYLNGHVPQSAIVETWEPELGVLTDHRYHYPPIALLDTAVRHEWLGGPPLAYNGLAAAPPYVALGPFGRYVGIYPEDALARDYRPLETVGPYTLYARR